MTYMKEPGRIKKIFNTEETEVSEESKIGYKNG